MNYMTIPNELVRATTYPKPTYTTPNNIAYSKHRELLKEKLVDGMEYSEREVNAIIEGEPLKKLLFVSQPMQGKTHEEIEANIEYAKKQVENLIGEVEVAKSYFSEPTDNALFNLSRSISVLSVCDCVYFCDGWQEARGCTIEHDCAIEYGITIVGE